MRSSSGSRVSGHALVQRALFCACRARLRDTYSAIALELWHVGDTCTLHGDVRPLARAEVRVRLAAARKVLLVPVTYAEWRRQQNDDTLGVYLLQKLRSAGMGV